MQLNLSEVRACSPLFEVSSEPLTSLDKLYFTSVRQPPSHSNSLTFFCIDNEYVYEPFYADFGPLNLGHVYTYWKLVKEKLRVPYNLFRTNPFRNLKQLGRKSFTTPLSTLTSALTPPI